MALIYCLQGYLSPTLNQRGRYPVSNGAGHTSVANSAARLIPREAVWKLCLIFQSRDQTHEKSFILFKTLLETLLQKAKTTHHPGFKTTLPWTPLTAVGDICSTQVCGALWSLLKGRSWLWSSENYALQSFTAFEGSDPSSGLARFKVSRETALCKETRNSVSNWSYCNKWKLVFQIAVADVQCLPHTHMLCCMCTQQLQSTCAVKSEHPTSAQHIWSRLWRWDADLLCTRASRKMFLMCL